MEPSTAYLDYPEEKTHEVNVEYSDDGSQPNKDREIFRGNWKRPREIFTGNWERPM